MLICFFNASIMKNTFYNVIRLNSENIFDWYWKPAKRHTVLALLASITEKEQTWLLVILSTVDRFKGAAVEFYRGKKKVLKTINCVHWH